VEDRITREKERSRGNTLKEKPSKCIPWHGGKKKNREKSCVMRTTSGGRKKKKNGIPYSGERRFIHFYLLLFKKKWGGEKEKRVTVSYITYSHQKRVKRLDFI